MTDMLTDQAVEPAGSTRSTRGRSRLGPSAMLSGLQKYVLLVATAILIVIFSVLRPETFFTVDNFTTILGIQAAAALLVIGITVVLLVGEFDLSSAATMGMSAGVLAYLTVQRGMPLIPAIVIVLIASAVIGVLNGVLVVKAGIHSFIVTLGMGTLVTGVAVGVAGTTTIGGVPDSFTSVFRAQFAGVQVSFWYVMVVAIVAYLVLGKMPLGRKLYFTGNAQKAAELAGIRTGRLRIGALVFASVVAGGAGIMLVGQTGAASPTIADPYLLPAYAAGFLGATAFTPGRFNIWGSLWSVYFLAIGTTGFQLLGFESWVVDFFNGAVLIQAVLFSRLFDVRKRLRRSSGQAAPPHQARQDLAIDTKE